MIKFFRRGHLTMNKSLEDLAQEKDGFERMQELPRLQTLQGVGSS
jgi:hypothetical protein